MWKPKSVRDQSQKLAWIISFQGFEMKIIKKILSANYLRDENPKKKKKHKNVRVQS